MTRPKDKTGTPKRPPGRPPSKPRKSKAKALQTEDPDAFLRAMMADPNADLRDRMAAALALKKGGPGQAPTGKKAQQQADAKQVVTRSLAPVVAPTAARGHLRAVK